MAKPRKNVDGSPIKDAEDKPGRLLYLSVLIFFPIFIFEKLLERIRRGR